MGSMQILWGQVLLIALDLFQGRMGRRCYMIECPVVEFGLASSHSHCIAFSSNEACLLPENDQLQKP
jgi:hypothetical protein